MLMCKCFTTYYITICLSPMYRRKWFVFFGVVNVWCLFMYTMSLLQVRSDTWFASYAGNGWTPMRDIIGDRTTFLAIERHAADYLMMFTIISAIVILLFDRGRQANLFIILQRAFVITLIAYVIRTLAFSLTTYPPPDPNCGLRTADGASSYFSTGLSQMAGNMTCTDLMFSGHALSVIISVLFLDFYTSHRSVVPLYYLIAIIASFFIIAAKMHYTVDVLFSWVIAIGLFTWYHMVVYIRCIAPRSQVSPNCPRKVVWSAFTKPIHFIEKPWTTPR